MARWVATDLARWLFAQARRAVGEERGIALVSQLAGLVVGIAVLGSVTIVFDAIEGVSGNAQVATTTVQRAQNAIDLITETLTDTVKGSMWPMIGTGTLVEAQVPEPSGGGFRVVRFCLQTEGENKGALYEQMVHEETVDSSSYIFEGYFAPCPDPVWTYNGTTSAMEIADGISNYEGSSTTRVFTFLTVNGGERQTLSIDLLVKPPNAVSPTELTGSVTPRLQIGPS